MSAPIIRTYTGKIVNPLALEEPLIDVRDIAHALALCNRFAGHTKTPISVAQHSVYVYRIVTRKLGGHPDHLWIRKQALFHDASEAYLGDVTKWLKQTPAMEGYRIAEAHAQSVIERCLGIPAQGMHPAVREADDLMVRFEGRHEVHGHGSSFLENHPNYPPITREERALIGRWLPWSWRNAETAFLKVYEELDPLSQRAA